MKKENGNSNLHALNIVFLKSISIFFIFKYINSVTAGDVKAKIRCEKRIFLFYFCSCQFGFCFRNTRFSCRFIRNLMLNFSLYFNVMEHFHSLTFLSKMYNVLYQLT